MGHHASVFDFVHGLPANANNFAQQQLRQGSFPAQGPEASGNLVFFPWPRVHFSHPLLAIVRHKRENLQ
jgi:hypothetical protein